MVLHGHHTAYDFHRSPRSIRAKQYVVMGHDYNLPFGPWGMEVDPEMRPGRERSRCFAGFCRVFDGVPRFLGLKLAI